MLIEPNQDGVMKCGLKLGEVAYDPESLRRNSQICAGICTVGDIMGVGG